MTALYIFRAITGLFLYNAGEKASRKPRSNYEGYEYSYYYDLSKEECQASCNNVLLNTDKLTYNKGDCHTFDVDDTGDIGGHEFIGYEVRLILVSDRYVQYKGYEIEWRAFPDK